MNHEILKFEYLADVYKNSHILFLPPRDQLSDMVVNFTARSAKYSNIPKKYFNNKIVMYGLQYVIKYYLIELANDFFCREKTLLIKNYKNRFEHILNRTDLPEPEHFAALHDLRYLPLEIRALPEGELVDIGVPLFTCTATEKGYDWLALYVESALISLSWKMITSATTGYYLRKILSSYAEKTNVPDYFVDIQAHDFSFRGNCGIVDSVTTSSGFSLSFVGSDTTPVIDFYNYYYRGGSYKGQIISSVIATEHNVTTLHGQEGELNFIKDLIVKFKDNVISIVSDTYDYFNVVKYFCSDEIKDIVMKRGETTGVFSRVVLRPDSGEPLSIICGVKSSVIDIEDINNEHSKFNYYDEFLNKLNNLTTKNVILKYPDNKYYLFEVEHLKKLLINDNSVEDLTLLSTPINPFELYTKEEWEGSISSLWEAYGGEIDKDGYKHLCPKIGIIYGDGINLNMADKICEELVKQGFATDCVVFGIGAYTFQNASRDTYSIAYKATTVTYNDKQIDLIKKPKTDPDGTKTSATGYLKVIKDDDGNYILLQNQTKEESLTGELKPVFRNSNLLKDYKYEDLIQIRKK